MKTEHPGCENFHFLAKTIPVESGLGRAKTYKYVSMFRKYSKCAEGHIQAPVKRISGDAFPGFEVARSWFWTLTPASSDYETVDLYRHFLECYHCVHSDNL